MPDEGIPGPTRRLRFRRYAPSDVDCVGELFGDHAARRFYPSMDTREAHASWVEWNLSNYEQHGFGLWIIKNAASGTPVGDCGLTMQRVDDEDRIEVGYHVKKPWRGMGYATQAATACVAYAFHELRADSVCSIVDPANQASIAVAGRIHQTQTSFTNARGDAMLLFTTDGGS